MNKTIMTALATFMMVLALGAFNQPAAGDLPETPITRILDYKTGLELTEAQIKNLNLVNNNIINQLLQVKAHAQNCKAEIDKAAANWSDLGNPKIKGAVKEYYKCQADIKTIEFDAMVQASRILSKSQIDKFSELVSLELIMNFGDEELTDND